MPEIDPLAEAAEIFGGSVSQIIVDDDEIEVELVLQDIRAQLRKLAEDEGVSVNQLARRLGVAPSSVSRFLNGEGDFRISTAVLYGRALGYSCASSFLKNPGCAPGGSDSV